MARAKNPLPGKLSQLRMLKGAKPRCLRRASAEVGGAKQIETYTVKYLNINEEPGEYEILAGTKYHDMTQTNSSLYDYIEKNVTDYIAIYMGNVTFGDKPSRALRPFMGCGEVVRNIGLVQVELSRCQVHVVPRSWCQWGGRMGERNGSQIHVIPCCRLKEGDSKESGGVGGGGEVNQKVI